MLQLRNEHRRHAINRRRAFLVNRLQGRKRVEGRGGKYQRRAAHHRNQRANHTPETVIQRHRNRDPIPFADPHALGNNGRIV